MKPTDNGVHHIHFIAPSKGLIIFVSVLASVAIFMLVYQQIEIQEMRKDVNNLRNYYTRMTGEFI